MKSEKPRTLSQQSRSRRRMLVNLAVASGVIAQPSAPGVHAADTTDDKSLWTKVLELNHEREPVHGSEKAGRNPQLGSPRSNSCFQILRIKRRPRSTVVREQHIFTAISWFV